ncbi:MAG: Gfo/Idh/MocA family oxidoreductase [Spirochaetota bacterium]
MTLNIGIVGIGFISEYHLKGFRSDTRALVAGVTRSYHGTAADNARQRKALEDFAVKHSVKAYESFEAMAASPDIDALVITSINPEHYGQVLTALENGKHVLIEKPVVNSAREIDELKKKSQEKGLVVLPAHNFAYRGAVIEAKRVIADKTLGAIQYASFIDSFLGENSVNERTWRSKHALSWGGALMDSGTHQVYQSLALLGAPQKVQAFCSRNVLTLNDEDIASVQTYYTSGAICHIVQNWGSNHGGDAAGIRIIGSKGSLRIADALYVNGKKINEDVTYDGSFVNQARHFISAVADGAAPLSTLDDAKTVLAIVHAAYESSTSGKTVPLE